MLCKHGVVGSTPIRSTTFLFGNSQTGRNDKYKLRKNLLIHLYRHSFGEIPKRLKGLVLKTSRTLTRRQGSNPCFSAIIGV